MKEKGMGAMYRKIFLCLILLFFFISGVVVSAQDDCSWTKEDCEETIAFIRKNINEFVRKYNEVDDIDEKLNASYVEYSTLLWLVEDDNYGAYIDFNENNGYLVMTGNNTIYALEVSGDYPEYRNENQLYFSQIDGFIFRDENGVPHKFGNGMSNALLSASPSSSADGNMTLDDLNIHIQRYYSSYSLDGVVEPLTKSFEYSHQKNTTYYASFEADANGNIVLNTRNAEGNCSLNSCFALLRDWNKRGYVSGLPTGTIDKRGDIKNERLYSTYGVGTVWQQVEDDPLFHFKAGKYYAWKTNDQALIAMPILYDELRTYAVERLRYTPMSGLVNEQIKEIMSHILSNYGNSVSLIETNVVSSAAIRTQYRACYLSVNNSYTYQNHAMVLLGYRKYSCETGWWIFKSRKYAYFLQVADGWSASQSVYFDPQMNPYLDINCIYSN